MGILGGIEGKRVVKVRRESNYGEEMGAVVNGYCRGK